MSRKLALESALATAYDGLGRRTMLAAMAVVATVGEARADAAAIRVCYIRWMERRPTISFLDLQAPDDGLAGAKLAMDDNNTTGRFIGQQYDLTDFPMREDDDPAAALGTLGDRDIALVLTDIPADRVLKLADAAGSKAITLFNIAAPDDALREADCRANVIHVAPSRDAGRRARAVSGVEEMVALGAGLRLASRRMRCWRTPIGARRSASARAS